MKQLRAEVVEFAIKMKLQGEILTAFNSVIDHLTELINQYYENE